MQCPMAYDRHILCAMALTDATLVFAKADIEAPMEGVALIPADARWPTR